MLLHVNAHGDIRLARAGVGVARPVSPSPKQTPAQVALGGGSALSTVNQLSVIGVLSDLLLFSCLAAFITGIILAVANVLS